MISRHRLNELEVELVGAMNWCPDCDELVLKTGNKRICPICDGLIYGRTELSLALKSGRLHFLTKTGLMKEVGTIADNLSR